MGTVYTSEIRRVIDYYMGRMRVVLLVFTGYVRVRDRNKVVLVSVVDGGW